MKKSRTFFMLPLLLALGSFPGEAQLALCPPTATLARPIAPPPDKAWLPALLASLDSTLGVSVTPSSQLALSLMTEGQQRADPAFYHAARLIAHNLATESKDVHLAELIEAQALLQLHYFSAAESMAERLAKQAGTAAAWRLLGDARLEQGKHAAAQSAYETMLQLEPSPLAWSRAARWWFLNGDIEQALKLISPAIDGAARSGDQRSLAWMLSEAGWYLLAKGEVNAAIAIFSDALAWSSNPELSYRLALAQIAGGQVDQALDILRRAFEQYPSPTLGLLLIEVLPVSALEEIASVRQQLSINASIDSLGYARFLLRDSGSLEQAAQSICAELRMRRDIKTLTTAAAIADARGMLETAVALVNEALTIANGDARLHLLAAQLGVRAIGTFSVSYHLAAADRQRWLLLPSERALLDTLQVGALAHTDSISSYLNNSQEVSP